MSKKDVKKSTSSNQPSLSVDAEKDCPTVAEIKENKHVVKLEKPKSTTKTPKVVEVIPDSNGVVVSFNSKSASAPTKQPEGSVADRASRFNRMALANNRINRNTLVNFAYEMLGSDITITKGQSDREIAFEIEGVRLPSQGFYFVS